MMNYSKAFKAGVLGTLVMTVLMAIARAAGVTALNIEMILGSMLTRHINAVSWMLGFMMWLLVGGIVAQLYAFGFEYVTDGANMWRGAAFSLAHASLAGIMVFALGSLHPLMRNNGGLLSPGPFAINYGTLTAVVFIGLHLVYGSWVGSLYSTKQRVGEIDESAPLRRAA